ncbi:MAG: PaaI family thioesterase [Halobacteriales archaeon]
MSHDFPDDAAETLQTYLDGSDGFLSRMGAEVHELSLDSTILHLEYHRGVANSTERQALHGGAIATLVDSAGGLALRPHLDDPVRDGVATISLNVDYLSSATDDAVAHAEVVRAGGTVGVSRVEIKETKNDETVAVGRGTYRLFTNKG